MKIGCTLINMEDIDRAIFSGVDYIEFLGKMVMSLEESCYEKLKHKIQSQKIPVWGMNAYCSSELTIAGPNFSEKNVREYAKKMAFRAAGLGVKVIGIGSPASRNIPDIMNREDATKQLERFLEITSEEFEQYGIIICLEALASCYCNFINWTEEALRVIEKMQNSNIRLVLDLYNMEIMNETNINLERLIPFLAHVHISDDDGGIYRRSYLKKEKAEIHKERIRRLRVAGYDGTISVEIDVPIIPEKLKETIKIIREI